MVKVKSKPKKQTISIKDQIRREQKNPNPAIRKLAMARFVLINYAIVYILRFRKNLRNRI